MTAENACGYQGSFIEATTVAFRPNELSTWANGEYNSSIQALNYADFNGCPQTYNSDSPTSCLPYLAFGTKLASTFQPAWSTCSFRDSYLPDPPYALIPATNLLPMPTGVDTVVTSTPASSASYIQPLPIETQSSTITAMDLSTQSTLIAATASSLLQESDPPFSSIDPFLSDLSETTTESDTTYPQAVAATATTEISISTIESNVVITGQTFTPGAIATILGTLYSIPQDPSTSQQPAQVTIAGVVYTADPQSNFLIGTQTYAPGATATISGTPVSIPPLPTSPIQPAKITVAGTVYTANSNSDFVIGTQTFSPGDTATIAGTPIQIPSLSPTDNPAPSSAMIITISGTRLTLAPTATASAPPDPKVFTFAGNTYTANSLSDFVIGTQILAPGGVITVSGTPISLGAASQTDVVVGTSTQILGSLILGMFNTPAPSGTGAGGLNGSSLFTGEAAREGIGAEGSGRRKALTVMGASVVWAWVLACS
ncbi:hypothetical protein MMC27_004711 [Xylographa pallens]|nr:hypothetical protein [Xylographa pallens]